MKRVVEVLVFAVFVECGRRLAVRLVPRRVPAGVALFEDGVDDWDYDDWLAM